MISSGAGIGSPAFSFRNIDDRIVSVFTANSFDTVTFNAVKADDISDNLTIRITSVDGDRPENAKFSMMALSASQWQERCKSWEEPSVAYDESSGTASIGNYSFYDSQSAADAYRPGQQSSDGGRKVREKNVVLKPRGGFLLDFGWVWGDSSLNKIFGLEMNNLNGSAFKGQGAIGDGLGGYFAYPLSYNVALIAEGHAWYVSSAS